MDIIGSIDNASFEGNRYYLIFTKEKLLQFLTMDRNEIHSGVVLSSNSNPRRFSSVAGSMFNYYSNENDVEIIIEENIKRGQEIENHLEEKLNESPPQYTSLEYSSISMVKLSNGGYFSLPRITFYYGKKKLEFYLVRSNYQSRGKLPDEVFTRYENMFKELFHVKLIVKK